MRTDKIIADGNLALILQCGGRGGRMGSSVKHKPLMELGDGSTPITNLLQDTPAPIPVFLHVLPQYVPDYQDFFSKRGTFGHSVDYLIQESSTLYDAEGYPVLDPAGRPVLASKGLMTFVRGSNRLPDYLLDTGGPKVGIFMPDVCAGLERLVATPKVEAVAFCRELTDEENHADCERWRSADAKDHPRYARLNEDKQRVWEHPWMCDEVFDDPKDWPAFTGMYLFKKQPFLDFVDRLAQAIDDVAECSLRVSNRSLDEVRLSMGAELGLLDMSFMRTRALDGTTEGWAYFLRTTRALRGFGGRPDGLNYRAYMQMRGHRMSIKTQDDVQEYCSQVEAGLLPRRIRNDM